MNKEFVGGFVKMIKIGSNFVPLAGSNVGLAAVVIASQSNYVFLQKFLMENA